MGVDDLPPAGVVPLNLLLEMYGPICPIPTNEFGDPVLPPKGLNQTKQGQRIHLKVWKCLWWNVHWVQLVLLEDLSGDVRDGVRGHTGEPVRWELLLLEEVAHLDWVGLSEVTKRWEELAGRKSGVVDKSRDEGTH